MGTDESNATGEMKETMEKELPNQQHRNKVGESEEWQNTEVQDQVKEDNLEKKNGT